MGSLVRHPPSNSDSCVPNKTQPYATDLKSRLSRLVGEYFVLVISIIAVLGTSLVVWHMWRLSARVNQSAAMNYAAAYSDALREFRSLYTSEVVARVEKLGVEVSHDYQRNESAIPLPATLTMAFGRRDRIAGDIDSRLYSDYPFPWRIPRSDSKRVRW